MHQVVIVMCVYMYMSVCVCARARAKNLWLHQEQNVCYISPLIWLSTEVAYS